MTIRLSDLGLVYLVCGKTDMRQGIDSLAYLVKSQFNLDPFSGQVYLFCGGRKDRFKALYWDGQGFWLLYKRFENGKLTWPSNEELVMSSLEKIIETQSKTIEMMANELTLLREQVEYLRQKLYGKSSEKVVHQPGQLSLFGEESLPEEEADLPS